MTNATATDTFLFHKTFTLPPDRIWHLLTDATAREAWGAPGEGNVLTMVRTDFRPGGTDFHRCGPEANPEFEVETRWLHIEEASDAVFTEMIQAGGQALGASLVTYRLHGTDAGSALDVAVAVSSFVGPEMVEHFREGWTDGLTKLDGVAAAHSAESVH